MVDVALALDGLVPGAIYGGSLTDNSQAAYEALVWGDERAKPEWSEILAWTLTAPVADAIPYLYAVAQLTIADGDIASINITAKLAGAFRFDVGQYWVFFTDEQSDTDYMALAYDNGSVRAFVAEADKFTGYFVVTTTDFAGELADPDAINLEIKRVS